MPAGGGGDGGAGLLALEGEGDDGAGEDDAVGQGHDGEGQRGGVGIGHDGRIRPHLQIATDLECVTLNLPPARAWARASSQLTDLASRAR